MKKNLFVGFFVLISMYITYPVHASEMKRLRAKIYQNGLVQNPRINWAYSVVVFPCQLGRMTEYTVNQYALNSRRMYRYMLRVNVNRKMITRVKRALHSIVGMQQVYIAKSRWIGTTRKKRFCFINGRKIVDFNDLKKAMLDMKTMTGVAPLLLTTSYILDLRKGQYEVDHASVVGTEIKVRILYRLFATEMFMSWKRDIGQALIKTENRARIVIPKTSIFDILSSLKKAVLFFVNMKDEKPYSVRRHMRFLFRMASSKAPRYTQLKCITVADCPLSTIGHYYQCVLMKKYRKIGRYCRRLRRQNVLSESLRQCVKQVDCKRYEECYGRVSSQKFCRVRSCISAQSFCSDSSTLYFCNGKNTWMQKNCRYGCKDMRCQKESLFKLGDLRCVYRIQSRQLIHALEIYSEAKSGWVTKEICQYGCENKRCKPRPVEKCSISGLNRCISNAKGSFIETCTKGIWVRERKCSRTCSKDKIRCAGEMQENFSFSMDLLVGGCYFNDFQSGRQKYLCGSYSAMLNLMFSKFLVSVRGDYYHGALNNWSKDVFQHAAAVFVNAEIPFDVPISLGFGAGYSVHPFMLTENFLQYSLSGFTFYMYLNIFLYTGRSWLKSHSVYLQVRASMLVPVNKIYPPGAFRSIETYDMPLMGLFLQLGYRTPQWF